MTTSHAMSTAAAGLWGEAERRRIVRLCTLLSGSREAAEDLAQETLLEAWRNRHKLHDPAGADRWLTAIARNVCLRWARRRGRDAGIADLPDVAVLDEELERAELGELVDRALAALPPETRDVVVQRYVHDAPHAEIGARLGISEDAVSMRLTRGKSVLRRVLASEDAADGAGEAGGWLETRVWCPECGRCRLQSRREAPPGAVSFRCPACSPDQGSLGAELRLANPFFARLVGDLVRPAAVIRRVAEWTHRYYAAGAKSQAACTRCGNRVTLEAYVRDGVRPGADRGLAATCAACGEQVSSSISALALALPEARRLRRDRARITTLPERQVDRDGVSAVVLRLEDLHGHEGVDVVFERDTLRVLHVGR